MGSFVKIKATGASEKIVRSMNSFAFSLLVACGAWLVHASSSVSFTNVYLTSDFQRAFEIDTFPSFAVSMMELDADFRLKCSSYRITGESVVYILSDRFLTDDPLPRIIKKVEGTKRSFFQYSGM